MTAAVVVMLLCMGVLASALGLSLYRAVVGALRDADAAISGVFEDYDGDC